MRTVEIVAAAGAFAEDKDVAKRLRLEKILPALDAGEEVTLDFEGVELATQSFIHALVSDLIRRRGAEVLDQLLFKNCNEGLRSLVSIVVEYSQDTVE